MQYPSHVQCATKLGKTFPLQMITVLRYGHSYHQLQYVIGFFGRLKRLFYLGENVLSVLVEKCLKPTARESHRHAAKPNIWSVPRSTALSLPSTYTKLTHVIRYFVFSPQGTYAPNEKQPIFEHAWVSMLAEYNVQGRAVPAIWMMSRLSPCSELFRIHTRAAPRSYKFWSSTHVSFFFDSCPYH